MRERPRILPELNEEQLRRIRQNIGRRNRDLAETLPGSTAKESLEVAQRIRGLSRYWSRATSMLHLQAGTI